MENPHPDTSDQYGPLLFWGVVKFNEQGSATAYRESGMIYRRYSDGGISQLYDQFGSIILDDITWEQPPACCGLKCFELNGQPVLVAALKGKVHHGTPPVQSHVYLYKDGVWARLRTPPSVNGYDFHFRQCRFEIDMENGYDIYYGDDSGVFWMDNDVSFSSLDAGKWNWVSFNCQTLDNRLENLLSNNDTIIEVRDEWGRKIYPQSAALQNTQARWDYLRAYMVFSTSPEPLSAFGKRIRSESTIVLYPALHDGSFICNLIPYLPTQSLKVSEGFASLGSDVKIVKNDNGEFWQPGDEQEFYLSPGEGYQVGVEDTLHFQYPHISASAGDKPSKGNPIRENQSPFYYKHRVCTGDYYPIYIRDVMVGNSRPPIGSEIGCFTQDDLCVGVGIFEGDFPVKVAAWKDDPLTKDVDGFKRGKSYYFKLYHEMIDTEILLYQSDIIPVTVAESSHRKFVFDGRFYAETSLSGSTGVPRAFQLDPNFPNPFNSATVLRYSLPKSARVRLVIYNILGSRVCDLVDRSQQPGVYEIAWDASSYSSGIYLCMFEAEGFRDVRKILLLK
jgi:hypothetical protein